MSMQAGAEMPRYQSHKKVWALKIARLQFEDGEGQQTELVPADTAYAPFVPPAEWWFRYHGGSEDHGYYVVYDDGYASWSPSQAFEAGYSRL